VDRLRVGDYVQRHDALGDRAGTPIAARTKAHVLMATLIKACEIQIQALTGGEVISPTPQVADRAAEQLEDGGAIEGVLEWPALLRKLDKIDRSYRD